MADFTASTGLKDILAGYIIPGTNFFAWATLHASGQTFVASDVYAAGVRGELATLGGYTRGVKTVAISVGTSDATKAEFNAAATSWTQDGTANNLVAGYCAIWINTTNSITGAKLLCTDDNPQTASGGGTMSFPTKTALITIPTPA